MNPALAAAVPEKARCAVVWMTDGVDLQHLVRQRPSLRRLLWLVDTPEIMKACRADPRLASLVHDPRVRMAVLTEGPSATLLPLPPEDDRYLVEGQIGLYLDPAIRRTHGSLCTQIEQALRDRVRSVLSGVAVRVTRGWHAMASAILNLPRLARSGTIEAWRDAARGQAAVVVGAGPSLDRNVHHLAEFRDLLFVVACDAALATLRRVGVRPDLVASTDHTERVWRFFAGLDADWAEFPIACLSGSAWPLIRYYRGSLVFGGGHDPRGVLFDRLAGPLPFWDSGHCVGHAAFELACLAGADPVILIGFDLGYDGDRFHARDMAVPYFHDSPPCPDNIVTVPGILGGCIRTEVSMLLYLREFERRFMACGRAVWDATEGGAAKAGTRVIPLRNALEEVASRPRSLSKPVGVPRVLRSDRAERVKRALIVWRDHAPVLLDELRRTVADLPGELFRFDGSFGFQDRFQDLLDLVSGANNPAIVTRFQFELEDWLRIRSAVSVPPDGVVEAGRAYLEDVMRCVELVPEAAALALSLDEPAVRVSSVVLMVSRAEGSAEPWQAVRQALAAADLDVRDYDGDPDDVPAIWRRLREIRAGTVVMLDGALFPASWAMPGVACFDLRLGPPGVDEVLEQWHWLPGYAVIGGDSDVTRSWRVRVPPDCPVYGLRADGRLQSAGEDGSILTWAEAIVSAQAATCSYLRANAKTA